jgi:lactoylglutathione lyase
VFHQLFPILTTRDMGRALTFYRDLLGWTPTYQFPPEGDPVYVGLELGDSSLGIGLEENGAGGTGPAAAEQRPANQRIALCVYADDCDAAIERLRSNGVPVLVEPTDQPWGERMARVADPDGNEVIVLSAED